MSIELFEAPNRSLGSYFKKTIGKFLMSTMSLAISGTSIRQDSNGRFCLNDLHKAAGNETRHKPANWLQLQNVQELIEELKKSDDGIPASKQNQPLEILKGGTVQGTFVVKELVYAYATWISAKFFLSVIRAYDALVSKPGYALRDLPPQTLTPAMKKHINQRVNYLVKHQVGASYASLGKLIQDTFNVNKRELILASKYPELCALLDCEPDPKALQGELVEPVVTFKIPAGKVLIDESELADLKKKPTSAWQNHATMILSSKGDGDAFYSVQFKDGTTVITEQPENVMIGTPEKIINDLQDMGFHIVKNDPQNKLETIVKIAQFSA